MCVYNVLRPKFDPTNGLYTVKNCLRLRSNKETQTRLVMESPNKDVFFSEFVEISGNWEFFLGDDRLLGFPRHNGRMLDGKCLPVGFNF